MISHRAQKPERETTPGTLFFPLPILSPFSSLSLPHLFPLFLCYSDFSCFSLTLAYLSHAHMIFVATTSLPLNPSLAIV